MEYTIDQREQAEKRVKELKKFYNTLASYIMAVLICTVVNLITLWDKIFTSHGINFRLLWIVWVIVPWGIVLLAKAIRLFWLPNSRHDWEEKKIQELLDKEKKSLIFLIPT